MVLCAHSERLHRKIPSEFARSFLRRLCKSAGIEGYKTNHSLRATVTSRLYQAGVDEQLVMERTGHRSVEGVRSSKRTSDDQRMALSDILNKRPRSNVTMDLEVVAQSAPATVPQNLLSSKSSYQQQFQALNLAPSCTFNDSTVNFCRVYVCSSRKRSTNKKTANGAI